MYLLLSLASLYILWILFLAVMSLKRAYDDKTISKPALFFGALPLILGLIVDFIVNVFVATFVFLEPPREFTVSERLSRLLTSKSGWRRDGACWFCTKFLDVFDPSGKHCK